MSEAVNQLVPVDKAQSSPFLRELTGILDIPLRVSIEVGRVRMALGDFLHLAKGAVIEVKKPAGEPFEISLNGYVVAKGEIIMVEQSSGVRIVEVLKPAGTS